MNSFIKMLSAVFFRNLLTFFVVSNYLEYKAEKAAREFKEAIEKAASHKGMGSK